MTQISSNRKPWCSLWKKTRLSFAATTTDASISQSRLSRHPKSTLHPCTKLYHKIQCTISSNIIISKAIHRNSLVPRFHLLNNVPTSIVPQSRPNSSSSGGIIIIIIINNNIHTTIIHHHPNRKFRITHPLLPNG